MNLKMKLNIYCGFDPQNYDNSISPSISKHVSRYGGNIFTIEENNYDLLKKKFISKFYNSFFSQIIINCGLIKQQKILSKIN